MIMELLSLIPGIATAVAGLAWLHAGVERQIRIRALNTEIEKQEELISSISYKLIQKKASIYGTIGAASSAARRLCGGIGSNLGFNPFEDDKEALLNSIEERMDRLGIYLDEVARARDTLGVAREEVTQKQERLKTYLENQLSWR